LLQVINFDYEYRLRSSHLGSARKLRAL